MSLVWIGLLIVLLSYLVGAVYTLAILYLPPLQSKRLQQPYKDNLHLAYKWPLMLFNMTLVAVLTLLPLYLFPTIFELHFPSLATLLLQYGIVLVVGDFNIYWIHRLLHHNKFLYRSIHALHHRASAPYPTDIYYIHPLDMFVTNMGVLSSFIIVYFVFGNVNIYVFFGYYCIETLHSMALHSGIEWDLARLFPWYSSTEHHDQHHAHYNGNYATMLPLWDKVFRTRIKDQEPK